VLLVRVPAAGGPADLDPPSDRRELRGRVELEYVDVIGDDRPDIVANKKGVFVFERIS